MWPEFDLPNASVTNAMICITVMAFFFLVPKLINCIFGDIHIPIRDTKHHNWRHVKQLSRACYCSICESLMISGEGVYCDCCGVCSDSRCMKKADKKLKCKAVTSANKGPMKHHWVKGNLSVGAICEVCEEECGYEPGLVDFQCCWCQYAVHTRCMDKLTEICDFGRYRCMTVPPGCVEVTNKRSSVRRNLLLRSVTSTNWPDWSPVIVIANRRSGNNDGDMILSLFRRLLNPAQVIDLADRTPEVALEWCSLLGETRVTVLVAGGDGTVAWVLNTIDKLHLTPCPAVAIIPLGTGNDLSRVLGWGKAHPADLDPTFVLDQIKKAKAVQLDRWAIEIQPVRHLGIRMPARKMYMYNYISIGVDAQVTLDFHQTRETSPFYLFSHRIFNKLLYLGFGTQQVMERGCRDLDQRLKVSLDGKDVQLPSIESIVVLNIPSWGAGVHLWSMGADEDELPSQSFSDSKLEICALYSSFHIAQLQVGLSQPHRLGQAQEVTITLLGKTAVQVDGEPWMQPPAVISIKFQNQATVLTIEDSM